MPPLMDMRSHRTRSVALALLATVTALLAACGGGDSTSPNPPAPPPPPPPPPPPADVWSSVAQRSWTVPANTEVYECHVEQLSTDKYITGFRLASPSSVQTELYLLMRPSVTQTGDFGCDAGTIDGGEAIYLAGPGTTQLEFTGGKGVHVPSGQYVMLVTHLVNRTSSSVSATTKVEGRVATSSEVTTPIDMFLGGRLDLMVPADGSEHIWNGGCGVADDLHVVAVIPLMRSLGVHATVTRTIGVNNQSLIDESFDPQHILYTSLTTDLDLPADARVTTSCTYVNNTGVVVNFGESASDELCFSGIYRYPPKPPTSISPLECPMGREL